MNTSDNVSENLEFLPDKDTLKLSAGELAIAILNGFDSNKNPIVSLLSNSNLFIPITFSMVPLKDIDIGREIIIMPMGQNSSEFVAMGILHKHQEFILDKVIAATQSSDKSEQGDIELFEKIPIINESIESMSAIKFDGNNLVIQAEQEIILRCGQSSIILSKNGKISFRGNYILNRATGLNRILGGAVQIN